MIQNLNVWCLVRREDTIRGVSKFVRHTLDLRPARCKRRTGSHIHTVLFSQQFSLKEIQIKSLFPFSS